MGNKLPKMDKLVQLVGIVLLFLAGLIGSKTNMARSMPRSSFERKNSE
jgi:hypothetical protein